MNYALRFAKKPVEQAQSAFAFASGVAEAMLDKTPDEKLGLDCQQLDVELGPGLAQRFMTLIRVSGMLARLRDAGVKEHMPSDIARAAYRKRIFLARGTMPPSCSLN